MPSLLLSRTNLATVLTLCEHDRSNHCAQWHSLALQRVSQLMGPQNREEAVIYLRGNIRVMSINALYNGRLDEVHAYSSAVKEFIERETKTRTRLTKSCVITFIAYFPHIGVAVDCDNVIVKPFVDGLKRYVLFNGDDNLNCVREMRVICRIGGGYAFEMHIHPTTSA